MTEVRHADRIADALEEMMFTGLFEHGQRLDEARLAKTFSVSRTPIREALQRLVSAGLARQMPRRGVFVAHPDDLKLTEMFETMAEVEGVCARLAAERMTRACVTSLEEINSGCKAAIDADDHTAYARHNERFHHAIYRAAGNAFLEAEALRLYKRLKPFRRIQLRKHGRMAASATEHNRLIDALSNRQGETAARELRSHVAAPGTDFYNQMAKLRPRDALRAAS